MKKGQTVLITAAAGATGHIGAQLAVLAGCTTIATCGGPKKAAALKKLGVQHIIDYKSEVCFPTLAIGLHPSARLFKPQCQALPYFGELGAAACL